MAMVFYLWNLIRTEGWHIGTWKAHGASVSISPFVAGIGKAHAQYLIQQYNKGL